MSISHFFAGPVSQGCRQIWNFIGPRTSVQATQLTYLNMTSLRTTIVLITSFMPLAIIAQNRKLEDQKLKFEDVLAQIETRYVDTVNYEKLVEKAIVGMINELDPHSEYMSEEEYRKMNEPLSGAFEGIGVQFNIIKDTIAVISPIAGGPSERLGIRSGDKIVTINDTTVAGIGVTNNDVVKKLRGNKGTKVRVGIYRRGVSKLIDYEITRDKIPIFSVDASYMIDKETGYIKLNRFSSTTMDEMHEAFKELKAANAKNLIMDLRDNSGGYLNTAIELSDEFLPEKKLIVFTEGKRSPRQESFATQRGEFEKGKVVILVDEGSASASEILAGALQDNDRGVIIGRRSYGKGLVQRPFRLRDGSTLKLTTARYYTPSGRCIQRPYDDGEEAYRSENKRRYEHGEFFNPDSVDIDKSQKFYTTNKRVVYGGGGIMPDIFVSIDTSESSAYLNDVWRKGFINTYTNEYVDARRNELSAKFPTYIEFEKGFVVDDAFMREFIAYVDAETAKEKAEAKKDEKADKETKPADPEKEAKYREGIKTSDRLMRNRLKANIARTLWGYEEYYRVANAIDPDIKKAKECIDDNTFRKLNLTFK